MFRDHQRADPASPWSRSSGGPDPATADTTGPLRAITARTPRSRRLTRLEHAHGALRRGIARHLLSFQELPDDAGELLRVREVDRVGGALDHHARHMGEVDARPALRGAR